MAILLAHMRAFSSVSKKDIDNLVHNAHILCIFVDVWYKWAVRSDRKITENTWTEITLLKCHEYIFYKYCFIVQIENKDTRTEKNGMIRVSS